MITLEEVRELKIGERIWYFQIRFGPGGGISEKQIVQLEKVNENAMKCVFIEYGPRYYWNSGSLIDIDTFRDFEYLFKDYKEGVNFWNSCVYNKIDQITSTFEKRIKSIKKYIKDD